MEKDKTMHIIQTILIDAKNNSLKDLEFECRNYSGRGMHGKYCLGIITSESVGKLFALIVQELYNYVLESLDEVNDDNYSEIEKCTHSKFCEISQAFSSMSQDNMGTDMVYYFPNVKFEEEED